MEPHTLLGGFVVIRYYGKDSVITREIGAAYGIDQVSGRVAAHPQHQRNPAGAPLHHEAGDLMTLRVGKGHGLSGGSKYDDIICACLNLSINQLCKGIIIN